ncbi:assimilatory nitrate reductase catalytic subunit [Rhodopseudomonas rhenobacensis]|uniref:Assimilatory nitrate reductase catalytic subunit n=1 Tax=Rhodopseudomonas rhenobacensis TaxID=87461 RepID=A0A7W7Z6P7_9BRAD|nr:nitrate reductase [Rhodopseudomonas rhenobacensis]MBB5048810.1 assimilatory nitrate reductase catalytic subunit [Rhodopseudomonas rhenobacensis]
MNALPPHPLAVKTTCAYCGVGCGILASPDGRGGASIAGDPAHPANFGRLCSKGSALGETLGLETRLLHPMLRDDDGALKRASWDVALGAVADGFARVIAEHGPDSVAFYLSGQLLTEDYYVANKLMKGFIGSANVDTNSRLCMASSVAGHRRAFGADVVPGSYADLDEADLVVLVGSNAAWCHPVLYQRMLANKRARGTKIVVIDPRRTESVEADDLFLGLAPGMDVALFSGLLVHLADTLALDYGYIDAHTANLTEALVRAREIAPDIAATARAAGLAESDVEIFFALFRNTPKVVTCFSQGVNQSAQGTDKVNAIINCHLATGRIGKPGMGPFSLTGQPNAMGGREVGGLANQLAAQMDFTPDNIDRVGRFWRASQMAQRDGLKAVQLFEAIARGEIKALWVMATNPAVSLPRAGTMREALRQLELLVISENVAGNDTLDAKPHVLLPAAAWGEKDGTVTNSERRISRQRAFLPLPGEARPDWWIVAQVALRMGFSHPFNYQSAAEIFREHAALSAFENDGDRAFDIGALAALSDEAFNAMEPVQWPARAGEAIGEPRLFAEGGFFTADRRALLIAPEKPSPHEALSAEFPFRLNTGRVRDQWHSMTRSGLSPRLAAHRPEPFVELHKNDVANLGLVDGGLARVTTAHGSVILKVVVSDGQRPGSLFAPIHWSDAAASSARVGDLVAAITDPLSGQPEAKATPAAIAPVVFGTRGFALTRTPLTLPSESWWSRVTLQNGHGLLFASNDAPAAWRARALEMFGTAELAEYVDEPAGLYRAAAFLDGRLIGCLFIGPAAVAPQWDAVKALFAEDLLDAAQRRAVLSGKSVAGLIDAGPMVCACFGVGLNTIRAALARGEATTVEQIGRRLRAGSNCGSCLPELRRLVDAGIQQPA